LTTLPGAVPVSTELRAAIEMTPAFAAPAYLDADRDALDRIAVQPTRWVPLDRPCTAFTDVGVGQLRQPAQKPGLAEQHFERPPVSDTTARPNRREAQR